MSYRVELIRPLGESLHSYPTSETAAFMLARSYFASRVNVFCKGVLIATKEPGTDRLNRLKGITK